MLSVLICSTPIHGHVVPLLALTRHLLAQGHRVRFLTGRRWQQAVEEAGATHLPLPHTADYDDRDMNGAFPGRAGLSGSKAMRFDMTKVFLAPLTAQLDAVDQALRAEHTDAVWWDELDGGRPVVHVTQGTLANQDFDELVAPTLKGLEHDDVLVVVSAGGRDVGTQIGTAPGVAGLERIIVGLTNRENDRGGIAAP